MLMGTMTWIKNKPASLESRWCCPWRRERTGSVGGGCLRGGSELHGPTAQDGEESV